MAMLPFSIEKHIAQGFVNALQKPTEIMLCLTLKAQFCFEKHWTIHVAQLPLTLILQFSCFFVGWFI